VSNLTHRLLMHDRDARSEPRSDNSDAKDGSNTGPAGIWGARRHTPATRKLWFLTIRLWFVRKLEVWKPCFQSPQRADQGNAPGSEPSIQINANLTSVRGANVNITAVVLAQTHGALPRYGAAAKTSARVGPWRDGTVHSDRIGPAEGAPPRLTDARTLAGIKRAGGAVIGAV